MRRNTLWLGLLAGSVLIAGCSSSGGGRAARDFEVYSEDGELDPVEYEPDSSGPTFDRQVERERLGARFAFGGEPARGFFQVFTEEWKIKNSTLALDGFGVGGGVKGAPTVGDADAEVKMLIPYRADLSLVYGEEDTATADYALGYVELHADVGFGVEWKGIRPSVGLALSSLAGVYTVSPDSGVDTDDTLTGSNTGIFFDILYKHEDYPVYGHLRALSGDYDVVTLGIGFKF